MNDFNFNCIYNFRQTSVESSRYSRKNLEPRGSLKKWTKMIRGFGITRWGVTLKMGRKFQFGSVPFVSLKKINLSGKCSKIIIIFKMIIWFCLLSGNKEFKYQYTLVRHIPTHTDERNFHCNVCSKSFRQVNESLHAKRGMSENRCCQLLVMFY